MKVIPIVVVITLFASLLDALLLNDVAPYATLTPLQVFALFYTVWVLFADSFLVLFSLTNHYL